MVLLSVKCALNAIVSLLIILVLFVEMASRLVSRVGQQLLCKSRCRLLTATVPRWRPLANISQSQSSDMTRHSVSLFHTSIATPSTHIVTIQDDKDFDDRVLQSQTPVLVDFFAKCVNVV